jgi:hypothetical protein
VRFFLLNPGGLAVFQVPTYSTDYEFNIKTYLDNFNNDGKYEMHIIPQGAVFHIARENGCAPLEVVEDGKAGGDEWRSNTFVLEKLRVRPRVRATRRK